MKALTGKSVKLTDGTLLARELRNREYLLELTNAGLLQNYYQEAGLAQNFGAKAMAHHGWEDPSCQLRGHFLGHYLSACAMRIAETGDGELKAKADAIVHELARCQEENGGQWAASIPEKYLAWIARGKQVWAPHYTVHKTFMGLVD
ncbi:MAG: glycoside hydrolase family 127 protein, partial [Lachnospiraceae bacterium]|nr:glycoside hydrolase family 127 protein [Lachnospiraceae bacterium]